MPIKKKHFYILLLAVSIVCSSCMPTPQLSPMQKRQITTRLFECSYENAYRASLTVLQDQGYIIKQTDMDSGLILAMVDRKTAGGDQFLQALFLGHIPDKGTNIEVSCIANKINDDSTDIRLNIQEVKYGESSKFSGTSQQDSKQIWDPRIYESIFNDIRIEIARREAMEGPAEEKAKAPAKIVPVQQETYIARVINPGATLKAMPQEDSASIMEIPVGAIFEIEDQVGYWIRVKLPPDKNGFTVIGFINEKFVVYEKSIKKILDSY